jgi:hypothetical protein
MCREGVIMTIYEAKEKLDVRMYEFVLEAMDRGVLPPDILKEGLGIIHNYNCIACEQGEIVRQNRIAGYGKDRLN